MRKQNAALSEGRWRARPSTGMGGMRGGRRAGPASSSCRENLLAERFHGGRFVVFHVEDGVQLGDLQQVVDFLGEVEQLKLAALIFDGGIGADQLADAGAVDVIDVAKVQQDFLVALAEQLAHGIAQDYAAFTEGDTAATVDNGHAIDLTIAGLHAHWEASLPSTAAPWTCLISLISVPVVDGVISTSSMNERIRKMPRPEVFNRFSGASGSGTLAKSSPFPWSRMVMTRAWAVRSKSTVTFLPGS